MVWGAVGERCSQVLHKGERIFVTGRLQTRSWEAPDGQKKYKTEIVADTIIGPDQVNKNLGGGAGGEEGPAYSAPAAKQSTAPKTAKKAAPVSADEINIDDIPF